MALEQAIELDRLERRGIMNWGAIRFMREWPVLPAAILVLFAVFAVFAPLLSPHDPTHGQLNERATPPAWLEGGSTRFLLGADALGRDVFSRIVYGTRVSLAVAGIVLIGGAVGGTVLGMISGWFGGQVDEFLMRVVDFMMATPFILVALVLVIVFGPSVELIIILLIVFSWDSFSRQIRGETLQLKTRDYIAAAQISGASTYRILFKHLLPGVVNTVLVIMSLRVGNLIITESILSYLGVGIPPPTPAWGLMVAEGPRLPEHGVVDLVVPRPGDPTHRSRLQLPRRLDARQVRPAPPPADLTPGKRNLSFTSRLG